MPNKQFNDQYLKAVQDYNAQGKLSKEDVAVAQKRPEYGMSMVSLQKDIDNAKTQEQRLLANEAANQLRKSYGSYAPSSTGNTGAVSSYGDQINKTMANIQNMGQFQYSGQDAYNQLLANVTNPQAFNYDPSTDPRMAAYKAMYQREGDRATQNALAQASAATGGVPSSYAVSAAAQAGNYYAQQLADKVPELYADAYNQHLNEQNMQLAALQAMGADREFENQQHLNQYNMQQQLLQNLQNLDNTEYNRGLDAWNQKFQQEQFGHQVNMDTLNQQLLRDQFTHQQGLDAWNQGFQEQQFAHQQGLDAWNQGFQEQQFAHQQGLDAWNQKFQQDQFGHQVNMDTLNQQLLRDQFTHQQGLDAWNQGFQEQQFGHQKYMDTWGAQMQQNQFNHEMNMDTMSQQLQRDQFNHQVGLNTWEQQFQQNQFDYQKQLNEADTDQQAFNNALALYQVIGYMTPEMEKILLGEQATPTTPKNESNSDGGQQIKYETSLTPDQVKQLQGALGITTDGWIGTETMGALGGISPEDAYNALFGLPPQGGYDPTDRPPTEGKDQTPSWLR